MHTFICTHAGMYEYVFVYLFVGWFGGVAMYVCMYVRTYVCTCGRREAHAHICVITSPG